MGTPLPAGPFHLGWCSLPSSYGSRNPLCSSGGGLGTGGLEDWPRPKPLGPLSPEQAQRILSEQGVSVFVFVDSGSCVCLWSFCLPGLCRASRVPLSQLLLSKWSRLLSSPSLTVSPGSECECPQAQGRPRHCRLRGCQVPRS